MIDGYTLPNRCFQQGYRLVLPTDDLVEQLAATVDPRVADEIDVTLGMPVKRALEISIAGSPSPYFVLGPSRDVLCAFGVAEVSVLDDEGSPWMIPSLALRDHRKVLLRGSRKWMAFQKLRYSALRNVVPTWYDEAIRWLKWLGFDILPEEPIGNAGAKIHKVQWVRED